MKSLAVAAAVVVSTVSTSLFGATKAERTRAAAKIVSETLRREASESIVNRRELLQPALEQIRDYKPALWHSGYFFSDIRKKWVPFEEATEVALQQRDLSTYRRKREELSETEEGQLQLARWCLKHGLRDQARAHLAHVLELNPDHSAARILLGFRRVGGSWIDARELKEMAAKAKAVQAALRQWRPKIAKIGAALQRRSREARQWARDELMKIDDPAAVGAIELVLCRKGGDSALLGVACLEQMDVYQAAEALASLAVFAPWAPIRTAAATALQSHRLSNYVPQLLDAAESPVISRSQIYEQRGGRLLYRHALYREDLGKVEVAVLDTPYRPATAARGIDATAIARADAIEKASRREQAVARHNALALQLNSRLNDVLTISTGESRPASISQWYDWWNDYNEVYVPSEKPVRTAYRRAESIAYVSPTVVGQQFDCLSGDAKVWTELGPIAIRRVRVGDRVFSCDVETGQLAIKPVLRVTLRPAGRLLRLRADGKTVDVSGGHPFWVSGEGWRRARELRPGMRLHTITGTAEVEVTDLGDSQESFNLVVADFHTYFVGDEMILTHDNTVRKPTNRIVPGLAATGARTRAVSDKMGATGVLEGVSHRPDGAQLAASPSQLLNVEE